MAVRGNQSRFKVAPFTVKFFSGRGYAIVDETGRVTGGYSFDRTRVDVACAAKIDARQRAAKAVTRPCLCCRQPFESAGVHNRMCGRCRSTSSAEGEPVGYSFGAMTGRRR